MNADLHAQPFAALAATLGECPVWHDDALWLVDIEERCFHRLCTDARHTYDAGQRIGFAAPALGREWIVGLQRGLARWTPGDGPPHVFDDPEPDRPDNRFNDGKADPAGRLYAGTLELPCTRPRGALYRLDHDLTLTRIRGPVTISNGLAWDTRRAAMYYIDTPTQSITRYDWDHASGAVANPSDLIRFDPALGNPDGMTIDTEGRLYVAMWDGGSVLCIDPDSPRILRRIAVDAPRVTSCTFGGPNLDTLYITTARVGLSPAQLDAYPRSGDIFVARIPGVRGLPASRFTGL